MKYAASGGAEVVTFRQAPQPISIRGPISLFHAGRQFLFGGSPYGYDVLVGVRGDASTFNSSAIYYTAGLDLDTSTLASGGTPRPIPSTVPSAPPTVRSLKPTGYSSPVMPPRSRPMETPPRTQPTTGTRSPMEARYKSASAWVRIWDSESRCRPRSRRAPAGTASMWIQPACRMQAVMRPLRRASHRANSSRSMDRILPRAL